MPSGYPTTGRGRILRAMLEEQDSLLEAQPARFAAALAAPICRSLNPLSKVAVLVHRLRGLRNGGIRNGPVGASSSAASIRLPQGPSAVNRAKSFPAYDRSMQHDALGDGPPSERQARVSSALGPMQLRAVVLLSRKVARLIGGELRGNRVTGEAG